MIKFFTAALWFGNGVPKGHANVMPHILLEKPLLGWTKCELKIIRELAGNVVMLFLITIM